MTPDGKFDFDTSRDMMIEAISAGEKAAENEILFDFRRASADLSMVDIYYLAAEMQNHKGLFRDRIALLISPEQKWDQAKFFEICAVNRGFNVAAFNSYEDAINWLFKADEAD
jgi:hypothetical protein